MDIDLGDYIAGGYFITKYADEGFYKSDLLPERVVSVSGCIGKPMEVVWGWDIARYQWEIQNFGIDSKKLEQFQKWCSGKTPGALYTLELAKEFIIEFLLQKDDVLLIGVGLPKPLVDDFLIQHKQTVFHANEQVYRDALYSVNYALSEGKPLPPDGNALGFEVVSYVYSEFNHSWLCSNLERDIYELFNIHTNEYGLINNYEEAKKGYEWFIEAKQGEPEPYHPWLLVQYPTS
jgi:hypothetical protein